MDLENLFEICKQLGEPPELMELRGQAWSKTRASYKATVKDQHLDIIEKFNACKKSESRDEGTKSISWRLLKRQGVRACHYFDLYKSSNLELRQKFCVALKSLLKLETLEFDEICDFQNIQFIFLPDGLCCDENLVLDVARMNSKSSLSMIHVGNEVQAQLILSCQSNVQQSKGNQNIVLSGGDNAKIDIKIFDRVPPNSERKLSYRFACESTCQLQLTDSSINFGNTQRFIYFLSPKVKLSLKIIALVCQGQYQLEFSPRKIHELEYLVIRGQHDAQVKLGEISSLDIPRQTVKERFFVHSNSTKEIEEFMDDIPVEFRVELLAILEKVT
jgi:hypothetical protein